MEDYLSDEEHEGLMDYLISEGAAEIEGLDEYGEIIYKFDMDVLEEVSPELHQVLLDDMDKVLIDLYKDGLIEVNYDEELNAQMSVSEEGREALRRAGFDLDGSENEDF
jgi:hypothetical protein